MKDKILEIAKETIETLGFLPVETRINNVKAAKVLKLVIHKKNGNISTEDCVNVANVVSRRLDMTVPGFSETYEIVTESPGADRKLADIRECLFFPEKEIKFILKNYEAYGLKENVLVGHVEGIENEKLLVRSAQKKLEISLVDVASAKLHFDIKKYLK